VIQQHASHWRIPSLTVVTIHHATPPKASKPVGQQNFGTSVQRFGNDNAPSAVKGRTPGPGAYEERRTAINIHTNSNVAGTGIQANRPFNQSAARFTEPLKSRLTPAPVSYNIESWQAGVAGVDITVQNHVNLAAKGAFGSTAGRPDPYAIAAKKQQSTAAPGEYNSGKQVASISTELMQKQQTSVFKSQTNRMPKEAGLANPPPNVHYAAEAHAALTATTGFRLGAVLVWCGRDV
jgi:hypothetical protein